MSIDFIILYSLKKQQGLLTTMVFTKYDKHNRICNTTRAYDPKIAEFKLYCKTFYNNNATLMYQMTRGKVELFVTYNLFQEAKQRGKQEGCVILRLFLKTRD